MGFGFQTTNTDAGDFLPLLTYSAKSGRFGVRESVERDGAWERTERELKESDVMFVADFATIMHGWLLIKKGSAPIKAFSPLSSPMPDRPAGYGDRDEKGRELLPKAGFSMRAMLRDGVLREFSGNSNALVVSIEQMLNAYDAAPETRNGMLPVLKLTGTEKADNKGNYRPIFIIEKWVPRPTQMGDAPATRAAAAPPPAAKPAANHVPPPAPKAAPKAAPAPAPAADDADDLPF
jgi:hypothetical protein